MIFLLIVGKNIFDNNLFLKQNFKVLVNIRKVQSKNNLYFDSNDLKMYPSGVQPDNRRIFRTPSLRTKYFECLFSFNEW